MGKYQTITYKIADIRLQVNTPWEEMRTKAFVPFVEDHGRYDWKIQFCPTDQQEVFERQPLFYNDAFKAYKKNVNTYVRQYCHDRCAGKIYATVCTDAVNKKVQIDYLPEAMKYHFGSDKLDFFHITLEKILIEENAMILHAACVDTPYGGLLFSGVSGAGKSTQAQLWCQYGQGKLINGDRPILKRTADGWRAYGSPYAGSSGCHLDENCRIRAIILPKKADRCAWRKLEGAEKLRKVLGNLTLNMWDAAFVSKAGDLTQQLIEEIPVYELECTMEKEAVLAVQELFEKEQEQWI